jgi:geranylgeranyl diphosphate synthase, type II
MSLNSLQNFLEVELQKINFSSQPANLYDPLRYFMTIGGKRIRPMLALMACEMFEQDPKKAINAAIAVELFHNFSLIHDDIMDEAPLRRGKETVHTKWNQHIAILSGDVLFVEAYKYLTKNETQFLPELLNVFNQTGAEVCEGQQLDMDFEQLDHVEIDAYIEMIRLKTSVLLGCSLKMGAIVAGSSPEDAQKLYDFGQHVGLAFQIQDDILDLYADPEKFGKQVGGDVLSNKKTLLALIAKREATAEQKILLQNMTNITDPEIKVEATRKLFDEIGVKSICEKIKKEHNDMAFKSLTEVDLPDINKANLRDLASELLGREF